MGHNQSEFLKSSISPSLKPPQFLNPIIPLITKDWSGLAKKIVKRSKYEPKWGTIVNIVFNGSIWVKSSPTCFECQNKL